MTDMNFIKSMLKSVSSKGFFNLLTANVLIQIVAFASQLFVAGILSPDDVGRIKILQTWLSIFSILGSMGFSSSTLKLCSENRTKAELSSIFRSGLSFTLITTLSSYAIVLVINQFEWISRDTAIRSLIPLAMLPLISNAFFALYVAYYQSQKEIKLISNLTSINKIVAVLLIIIFTWLGGIKGYYIGFNLGAILLLIVVVSISRNRFGVKTNSSDKKRLNKMHWHYARPSFFSLLLADLASYADILIINYLIIGNITEVGFYSFALTLTVMFRVLPSTVQQITIPYFSGLSNNIPEFSKVFRKYSLQLILLISASLIAALVLIPPFITIIFSGKYDASIPYFIPLAIGWTIRQYNQIQAAALFGIGAISKIARSQFLSLISNVILILISLYYWGIMGVAYSSIVCAIIEVSLFSYFLRRKLKG